MAARSRRRAHGERGRLVIAGYHQDGPRQVNMQLWNWRGIDVINAHERDPRRYVDGMRAAVDLDGGRRARPVAALHPPLPARRLGEALELDARSGPTASSRRWSPHEPCPHRAHARTLRTTPSSTRTARSQAAPRLPRRRLDRPAPHGRRMAESGAAEVAAIADPHDDVAARGAARWCPRRRCCTSLDALLDAGARRRRDRDAERAARRAGDRRARARPGGVLPEAARAHRGRRRSGVVAAARRADRLLGVDLSYRHTTAMRRIAQLVAAGELGERVRGRSRLPQRLRSRQAVVLRPGAVGRRLRDRPRHPSRRSRAVDARLPASSRRHEPHLFAQRPAARAGALDASRTTPSRSSTSRGGARVRLACSWNLAAGCDAVIEATFYGTRGGAALRNVDGSFYDFVAERYRRHARDARCAEPPDAWGGRAAVDWARAARRRRAASTRRSSIVVEVARVLDAHLWPLTRHARAIADDGRHRRRRLDLRARTRRRRSARAASTSRSRRWAPLPSARAARRGARLRDRHSSHESAYRLEWMDDPGTTSTRAGEWLLELERRASPDVVHLNRFASRRAAVRAPVLRRRATRACCRGGARCTATAPAGEWDALSPRVVDAGLRAARRWSSRRRARCSRARSANYGHRRAGVVLAERPQRARLRAGAARSRSSSPPAGSGTRRRTSQRSKRVAPRLAWPVHVAGATVAPDGAACATDRQRARARRARRRRRSPSWLSHARRSTRCRRATSRSACRCSRRRCPAARWCSATSPACARSGATPRSTCRPTTTRRCTRSLSPPRSRPDRAAAALGRRGARARAALHARSEWPTRTCRRTTHARRDRARSACRAEHQRRTRMRIVIFYHSLVSDWNHGNAHFLRGVVQRADRARPRRRRSTSRATPGAARNLVAEHGERAARRLSRAPIRSCAAASTTSTTLDLDARCDGADLVLVHEWNDPALVRAHRPAPARRTAATGCCSTTRTTARVTEPHEHGRATTSRTTTACSRSASVIRDLYLRTGWATRAWTWHEAADMRALPSACPARRARRRPGLDRQLGRRRARRPSCDEFLLEPVRDARACARRVHGVRYPEHALHAAARGRHRLRRLAAELRGAARSSRATA